MSYTELTDEERAISLDVLSESLNLGLGHVIEELSQISKSKIELHVPEINMIPKAKALHFADRASDVGKAIFVQQQFGGDIAGEALLFFSEEESLSLLNGILNDDHEPLIEFAAMEEEMLLDLTNVAVSGVIYSLSNLLSLHIDTELPRCDYGQFHKIRSESRFFADMDDMVLFLTISFTVVEKNATAQLMFFQPKDALSTLYTYIQRRIASR